MEGVPNNKYKAIYEYDNGPAASMCRFEPSFSVPAIQGNSADWVDQWLVNTGYGRYRPCFRKHGITGTTLLGLTLDGLRAMGVKDKSDAEGILANMHPLRSAYRHMEPEELPAQPYTHYRALYFGQQPTLDRWLTSPTNPGLSVGLDGQHICSNMAQLADHRSLARIRNEAGDRYGWFQRNRPHQLI